MGEHLERGRACYAQFAWIDAVQALALADEEAPLAAADLERLAFAAGLSGDTDLMLKTQERLHHMLLTAADEVGAARVAFWMGYRLIPMGEMGRAQAWLGRAQRLLERMQDECSVHGFVLLPMVHKHLNSGDYLEAQRLAVAASEIGERQRDADLLALARIMHGRARTKLGNVEAGLALFDEAMLAVTAREVSPVVTALVYCHVISACSQIYALDRAREWTAGLTLWLDEQPQALGFTGTCLVHRAELMELGGDWKDALEEACRAQERLDTKKDPKTSADALYQQAEIFRLRGELTQAEETYARTSAQGREPLPGLALLRLAQGRSEVAASSMRRIVSLTKDPLQRARYLPAHVEIMLAVGAIDEAAAAAKELGETAMAVETDVLRAIASQAQAAVALARGCADVAVEPLREALLIWRKLDAPYLAARLHALLAQACEQLGDTDGAELERRAAREAFVQLGAAPDLAALDAAQARAPASTPPKVDSVATTATHNLSPRELQVLRVVASGKTNRVIAAELFLSEKTVDRHLSNIFTKLGVSSRTAATAYAYEHGLV